MDAGSLFERSNLSRGQFLIWTGQRLEPDAPLYNMALSQECNGSLDPAALRAAFHALVAGSDALRTVLVDRDGVPQRRVLDRPPRALEELELADAAAYEEWAAARSARPFDLEEALYDAVLVRLRDGGLRFFLNQHHLVTDGWSCAVLYRRLDELYRRAASGTLEGTPALPAFEDWVAYERGRIGDPRHERALAHWRGKLGEPFLPSVFYGRRPDRRGTRTARTSIELGEERARRLATLAGADGIRALTPDLTRFQLFATALFALLHRTTGNRAPAILTPAHNRPTAAFKETVGLFIEIFPLHLGIDEGESYRSLLAKVSREAQTMLLHARPGTSHVVHGRPYDVVLNFITAQMPTFAGVEAGPEWLHPGHGDRNHTLRLQVYDFGATGSTTLSFDLNEDVFPPPLRARLIDDFLEILDDMLEDPDRPLVSAATVPSMFRRQVEKTPAAEAVRMGGEAWSYRELAERSARWAAEMRRREVGRGDLVALRMGRSPELVAAILGTLEAGAAYLPLDPRHPEERVAAILEDAGVSLVLEDGATPIGDGAVEGDEAEAAADDLAYVIYTSGSTGRPKGVEVSHRALAHYVDWARRAYASDRSRAFALYSSIAFDLTVTSLFVPLVSGGRIVVYPESEQGPDLSILDVFAADEVDTVKLTPSHLALLRARDLLPGRLDQLIVGGEELRTELAASIATRSGGRITIHNEYGPTEATVGCVVHRFDPERDTAPTVPIGHAVDGTTVQVDAPRGEVGELVVEGPQVADGYRGGERFAGRYRTGDLGRLRPDGVLEFLGRRDRQLKVRGARVEPAEIERTILAHPEVTECVVDLVTGSEESFCARCGLSSRHPEALLDEHGVCNLCREYDRYAEAARSYFGTMAELERVLAEKCRPNRDGQDCVMLLSGGKDSTYALYQVVALGRRPLVFTLDNGFISEGAKANIRRATDELGLELVFGSTTAMNAIFADSLARFSNVCQGCFKTIYTLATALARERGLGVVVTGLSRGQIFETRLADCFRLGIREPEEIDRMVVEARKAYHRMDDAVARHLDVSMFDDDRVFEEVSYVDFYRYCDVSLEEVLSFLARHAPWIRPQDTGRSTNCLINDAGIWVHRLERGYHNYALPYSWDVRLGHKTRRESLQELDDEIDEATVRQRLREIGYQPERARVGGGGLVAYYVAERDLDATELRQLVAERLPEFMVPASFVRLDQLPLTSRGKIDREALPSPRPSSSFVEPATAEEETLLAIWREMLGLDWIGVDDDFFELGGDSITAIRIVTRAHEQGIELEPHDLFEHPTVARVAAAVVGASGRSVAPQVVAEPEETRLSPLQEGMFFHSLEAEGSGVYHEQYSCRLEGDIEPETLEEAWRTVSRRHEVLRMGFGSEAGEPRPFVVDDALPVLERLDWTGREEEAELAAWREADLVRPFDFERPPLMRVALARVAAGKWRLLWSYHHILLDGWSRPLVLREVLDRYRGLALPDVRPYRELQRQLFDRLDRDEAERFWKSELEGMAPCHFDLPPGAGEGHGRIDFEIETAPLLAAARAERVTLATLLLGGWALLLSRYTDREDVIFGTTTSGRPTAMPGVERMIGLFMNTLPVRSPVPEDERVGDWLRRLQQRQAAGRRFEHTPLREIQRWAGFPGRPLFDSLLSLANYPSPSSVTEPPRVADERYDAHTNLPLAVVVQPGERARVSFIYDRSRFPAIAVERMAGHLLLLLERMAEAPERRLGDVAMTAPEPIRGPALRIGGEEIWHRQFERRVEEAPEHPAVVAGGIEWSYRSLNGRANRLARELRQRGVGRDVPVAIHVDRSPEMLLGMLAVLKAGGAYVPLDPAHPVERLAALVAEVDPPVMLTTRPRGSELGAPAKLFLEDVTEEADDLAESPGPDDLAYVIYTSGSTGEPRGTMVSQRNLWRSTAARRQYYDGAPQAFLLLSSFAFDSSVAGIFWTLAEGGTLYLPPGERLSEPSTLRQLIQRRGVTHLLCIPALYREILAPELDGLRVAIVAGEACPPALVEAHRQALPDCALFNEYGPTEATVWSTVFDCRRPFSSRSVPIGQPIPGAVLRVVDSRGRPMPPGAPGELFIGGDGVARGYRGRESTAFLPDPDGEGRLFRTGDRVRLLESGDLEFLGRVDQQLKIRGHRIEPAEIEAALGRHPGVREAAVVAMESQSLADRLATLDAETAAALLREVEESAVTRTRTDERFELSLVVDDDFVRPPRDAQRNWLLEQSLDELADDLRHLDGVARRFVAGAAPAFDGRVPDREHGEPSEQEIMEDWQIAVMRAMAQDVTESHGDVLEVGFGRGVSAELIQQCGVRSHTVVEANASCVERFYQPFRERWQDRDIRLIEGRWQDVEDRFALYDGIFFHAVPLDESEFLRHMVKGITFAAHFFPVAARHLRPGGVFSYLSTEIDSLSRRHQRALFRHFSSISLRVQPVEVPVDTRDAWWADSMVVVKAVR